MFLVKYLSGYELESYLMDMFKVLTSNLKECIDDFKLSDDDYKIWSTNVLSNESLNTILLSNLNGAFGYFQFINYENEKWICEL